MKAITFNASKTPAGRQQGCRTLQGLPGREYRIWRGLPCLLTMKSTLRFSLLRFSSAILVLSFLSLLSAGRAAESPRPLRALLIAGGCCHDYAKQKDLLKQGIEARAHVQVDVVYSPDSSTRARFDVYEKSDWARGYDVIIHDDKGPPGDLTYSFLETTAYVIFPPVWPFVFRSNRTQFTFRVLPKP